MLDGNLGLQTHRNLYLRAEPDKGYAPKDTRFYVSMQCSLSGQLPYAYANLTGGIEHETLFCCD